MAIILLALNVAKEIGGASGALRELAMNWQEKKLTPEQIKSMTPTEKQARIAGYIYDDKVSEDMLDSILAITVRTQTGERNEG